jgi:hypothetical protein
MPQSYNNKILYSHRVDEKNPGDMYSTSKEYFPLHKHHQTCDVFKFKSNEQIKGKFAAHITGGGDILVSDKWYNYITEITKWANAPLNVVWGAGVNLEHSKIIDHLNKYYKLIGTRTYSTNYPSSKFEFVPCASVMNKLLDKEYKLQNEVIVINHFKRNVKGLPNNDWLQFTNRQYNIETMIKHIGSAETVVTNSYHAAYWAMLLNKKVYSYIEQDDCKLSTFKHKPIYFKEDSPPSFDETKIDYSDMKQEYRELNNNFFNKVLNEYS